MRVVFYLDLFVVVVVVVLSGPFFKLRFLKGKDITREERQRHFDQQDFTFEVSQLEEHLDQKVEKEQ